MTVRFCRDQRHQSGDLSRSYGFNSRGVENRILGSSRNGGAPYSGPLAQLVEHLFCTQKVAGSIPVRSTDVSLR